MERLRTAVVLLSLFSLNAGCVRSVSTADRGETRVSAAEAQSFGEYVRTLSRVSAGNAQRSQAEREALLQSTPELKVLLDYVETHPSDAEAKLRLARAYLGQDLYWTAHELLQDISSRDPGRWDVAQHLAEVWDALGDYEVAAEYAEQAVENQPSKTTYELLGRIRLHQDRFPEASSAFKSASDLGSPDAVVLANTGFALMSQGHLREARSYLEQAVLLHPTLPEARNNLAIVLARLNDYEGALKHLLEVGTPAVAWNNMGSLYLQQGMTWQAHEAFRRSLELDPDYELAAKNLAVARSQLPRPVLVDLPRSEREPAAMVRAFPEDLGPIEEVSTVPTQDNSTIAAPAPPIASRPTNDASGREVGLDRRVAESRIPENAVAGIAVELIVDHPLTVEDSVQDPGPATVNNDASSRPSETASATEPAGLAAAPEAPELRAQAVSARSLSPKAEHVPEEAIASRTTAGYSMPLFLGLLVIGGIIVRRQRPSRDLTIEASDKLLPH